MPEENGSLTEALSIFTPITDMLSVLADGNVESAVRQGVM